MIMQEENLDFLLIFLKNIKLSKIKKIVLMMNIYTYTDNDPRARNHMTWYSLYSIFID